VPRFLALESDALRLHLLAASSRVGSLRLEKTLVAEEEKALAPATAADIGARLKELLKEEKIAPNALLVSVPRDRVVLKEIKIPVVPAHEEPAVVRFQALREFTENADEIVIDFTPLSTAGNERRVQIVSVRKDFVLACKKLADAVGVPLKAVAPRSYALLAGLQRAIAQNAVAAPEPGAATALLVRGERWGELIIQRGGNLILARSIAAQALSTDAALIGELRRNLAIHANQNPDSPVRAIYLPEPDSVGGLRERLQAGLEMPVHSYEPLAGLPAPDGPRGTLVGLAGIVALASQGEFPINFAKPREPKPPRDPQKRLLGYAAAAALILVLAFGAFAGLHLFNKERQIANLEKQKQHSDNMLRQLDPDAKRLKAIDEWAATDINWLDELYEASARTQDGQRIRVTSFTAAPIDNRNLKSKQIASISIRGVTTDHQPVANLVSDIDQEPSYRRGPTTEKRNTQIERFRFPQEFTFKYDIEKRPANKYTRTFTAELPPKRSRGDAGGFPDFGGMFP